MPTHLQNAEPDIDTVEVRDNVQKEQERHEPPHEARDNGGFEAVRSRSQNSFHGWPRLKCAVEDSTPARVASEWNPRFGTESPDVGHNGRARFFQIGQLAGQNRSTGKVPMPRVKAFGDQLSASLEVNEADLRANVELRSVATSF